MKKTAAVVASMLLGSSSLALGCAVHESASVSAPPPPQVVVEGQVGTGGQTELIIQGAPPPAPPVQTEVIAASPGPDFFWVGGYHRWNGHEYVWVGGRYERRPHANAQWKVAHWEPRGATHVWIEGNWEGAAGPAPAPAPAQVVAVQGPTEVIIEGEPPAPPPVQTEPIPPAPSPEHIWIGGYHRWDGHAYVWTKGRYEHRPHPGAKWKAAHWEPRGHQHVWVEGEWEGAPNASANAKVEERPAPPPGAPPAAAGAHPFYLKALSDLRVARANLERKGGDKQMKWDEKEAIGAIDRAIKDIKEAAVDDGKNLEDHPAIDVHEPRGGRLHRAGEALHAARADIDKEEDNAFARGLRGRASHDIDEALKLTQAGIQAAAAIQ
jgi:hypothetical protein